MVYFQYVPQDISIHEWSVRLEKLWMMSVVKLCAFLQFLGWGNASASIWYYHGPVKEKNVRKLLIIGAVHGALCFSEVMGFLCPGFMNALMNQTWASFQRPLATALATASVLFLFRGVFLGCRLSTMHAQLSHRADSRLAPRQWETSLQSNAVSHWLGAN